MLRWWGSIRNARSPSKEQSKVGLWKKVFNLRKVIYYYYKRMYIFMMSLEWDLKDEISRGRGNVFIWQQFRWFHFIKTNKRYWILIGSFFIVKKFIFLPRKSISQGSQGNEIKYYLLSRDFFFLLIIRIWDCVWIVVFMYEYNE